MKKLLLSFLLLSIPVFAVEQKFVYMTAEVRGYNELQESPEVNKLLKQGWKIKIISAAGSKYNNTSNIFIVLEKE